jgi:hypothetical protein
MTDCLIPLNVEVVLVKAIYVRKAASIVMGFHPNGGSMSLSLLPSCSTINTIYTHRKTLIFASLLTHPVLSPLARAVVTAVT